MPLRTPLRTPSRARLVMAVSLAVTASLASPAGAQPLPDSTRLRIDRLFGRYDSTSPGCLVGVGKDDKVLFATGYGMSNLEYGVPLTRASISESGSVAKQFTAAAVVLLQLDGKLSLDDDIRKYLPEVPDFGATITIRNLLTHTSGLRDQWALLGLMGRDPGTEVHTHAEILDLVHRQQELNFPVGSEYLYSNTGYVLAATIVSRVSGMPFATFSRERLFKPLGMTHTQWRDDFRRVVPGRATAYTFERGAWVQDMPFTMVHGNGGLLSTIDDLLRWNDALTDGFPGYPGLTKQLETTQRLTNGRQLDYALGLSVAPWSTGVREVSHSGSTAGYRTWMARYPEVRTSVAVWCNAGTANAGSLGRQVAMLVVPRTTAPRPSPTTVAAEDRDRVTGIYRDPRTDDYLTIATVGDYLRVIGPSSDSLRAERAPGRFSTGAGYQLTFAPSDAKATSLHLQLPGGDVMEMLASRPPTLRADELSTYAGTFRSPELGSTLVFRVDKGRLLVRFSPDEEAALVPLYEDGFRMLSSGFTARFTRSPSGQVTGARIFAGRARNVRFERVP
ncbi:MAG: serine hydrolase [Gemmatimonadota bacterium]